MAKTTIVSIAGLALLLAVLLGCGTLGLSVRMGVLPEVLVRFPPNMRYQLILRVGDDSMPWNRGLGGETAINLWAHGQGTSWHIVNIVHVPLGYKP
ncbi:MAG TPA: hypothetical protein VF909_06110 [Roseiflexaceae bacterium]|jgi:hypothetical protein